jgi:Peptidase family M28
MRSVRRHLIVGIVAAGWLCASTAWPQIATRARLSSQQLMKDVQTLASPEFEGRRTSTPGNAKARAWIVERFREAGLAPVSADFQMPFQFTRNSVATTGVNVIGLCKGSGAADTGVMVITAHYDHLGVMNGQTYPGADDNASGVATIPSTRRSSGCRARARLSQRHLLRSSDWRSTSISIWSVAARRRSCTSPERTIDPLFGESSSLL